MLRALLWKDLRVNRLPLFIGVVLFLVPHGIVAAAVAHMPLWTEARPASALAVLLGTSSYFSIMCSQAALAMLSGHVIAAERGDRSAEFLAYLPPTRAQVLLSKAAVLLGAGAVVWGVNLGLRLLANYLADGTDAARSLTGDMTSLGHLAALGALAVGGGWCASAMLENSGPAVALALVAPVTLFGVLEFTYYVFGWPDDHSFARIYFAGCWLAGIALFAGGSTYYLRRIEP